MRKCFRYYGDSYDLPEKFGLNQTLESGPTTSHFTDNIRTISKVVAAAILKYSGVQNVTLEGEVEESNVCIFLLQEISPWNRKQNCDYATYL